ncbi:hypothetical protein BJY52DRAFT_1308246 [Lactarius psammicola]|nr:hypothetical protein BJY52DRAFT_1308246 [Lactarius psammicola]
MEAAAATTRYPIDHRHTYAIVADMGEYFPEVGHGERALVPNRTLATDRRPPKDLALIRHLTRALPACETIHVPPTYLEGTPTRPVVIAAQPGSCFRNLLYPPQCYPRNVRMAPVCIRRRTWQGGPEPSEKVGEHTCILRERVVRMRKHNGC